MTEKDKLANRKSGITCHHCGGNNHKAEQCRFINSVCHNCGKKGHLKIVCKCPKQKGKATMVKPRKPNSSTVHRVETQDSGEETCQLFMSLLVVPGNGPSLLGRSWLRHIQLDWREVNRISTSGNYVEAVYSVL